MDFEEFVAMYASLEASGGKGMELWARVTQSLDDEQCMHVVRILRQPPTHRTPEVASSTRRVWL